LIEQDHRQSNNRAIPPLPGNPVILRRHQHQISRRDIDQDVLKIIHRLNRHGYTGFLTGAAVQNLLQGIKPKDFDLVTDAGQNRIKRLYSNAFIIGRRFRLAHLHFKGGKIIELSTFRRPPEIVDTHAPETGGGRPKLIGNPMEDAFQRDISINALFYDVKNAFVIDYVQGLKDLAEKRIRIMGDPEERFSEDAVRILRAIRHSARLGFHIEKKTEAALYSQRHLLADCGGSRLYVELNRDLANNSRPVFEAFIKYGILGLIIGGIGEFYQVNEKAASQLLSLLAAKDQAASSGVEFSQAELYAMLFWYWMEHRMAHEKGDMIKVLHDEIIASLSGITLPNKVRSGSVQILILLRKLIKALRTGHMRTSWLRHKHYADASRLFFLIKKGRIPAGGESFESLFRQSFRANRHRP
jgi:poly(A) polymerase